MRKISYQIIKACKQFFACMEYEKGLSVIKAHIGDWCALDPDFLSYRDVARFVADIVGELNLLNTGDKIFENIKYFANSMGREREIAKQLAITGTNRDSETWILEIFKMSNTFLMLKVTDIPGFREYLDSLNPS